MAAGALALAWGALWPTSIRPAGKSVSCGAPVVRLAKSPTPDSFDAKIDNECKMRSLGRFFAGFGLGFVLYVAAAIVLFVTRRPPAGWYPDPSGTGTPRWWDGRAWGPATEG